MEEKTNREMPAGAGKEGSPLEKEIFELERKISEKKRELEKNYVAQESPRPQPAPPVAPAAPTKPAVPAKKPGILEANPKVKALVDMAFHEGIHKAIEEVKKTDDPYLIDAFHDSLVGELYDRLIKEGLLKET